MKVFIQKFRAMGGSAEICVAAADQKAAEALFQPAMAEVLRIEQKYSRYRADSVVSGINRLAGSAEFFDCDDETCFLLDVADDLYRRSGGLFDITSGLLRRAWDFDTPRLPDPDTLKALIDLIGWSKVVRSEKRIQLPQAGMELDFGGFGKEYAVDRAADQLARMDVRHGFVNLGGDVRALGPQPDGQPWVIGVQDPRINGRAFASIPLTRGALTTSGDYERYFELDGKRYCHVLNPRTGFPVSYWRSVSIVAASALEAGSLSTMSMLMESDAQDFLRSSGKAFLCVDHQGNFFKN